MKCLDLTLPTPAENLACDEVLLAWCEQGKREPILRFWEPAEHFVVLGYANRVNQELHPAIWGAEGRKVYRRCSGGGSVVQGPGCMNYALILEADGRWPLGGIATANRFIMEKHRAALQELLASRGGSPAVTVEGHTDLAVNGKKCAGNAQRRSKSWLLFHGTFLLQMDLEQIERALPLPPRQPAYRKNRSHREFLVNLDIPAESLKLALRRAWSAGEPLEQWPLQEIQLRARDKYETKAWNFKF